MLILQTLFASKTPLYLRHRSPGRLRVAGDYFTEARPEFVRELESVDTVSTVSQNTITQSLLVCFQEGREDDVFRQLLDLLPSRERLVQNNSPRVLPHIGRLMRGINRSVHTSTFGWFDAQVLIPTFLCVYGVRRLIFGQPRLPTWVTIFWWSYATLWNLSQMEAKQR